MDDEEDDQLQLNLLRRGNDRVRTGDPDTSHEAAKSLDVSEAKARVWAIHLAHPEGLTDEQLLHYYEAEHPTAESSPRKRRCDLTRTGLIGDSGQRRQLKTGRMGIVWIARRTY